MPVPRSRSFGSRAYNPRALVVEITRNTDHGREPTNNIQRSSACIYKQLWADATFLKDLTCFITAPWRMRRRRLTGSGC